VFGVDGDSWNNKRPAGVAFAFQVSKHLVECHADDASNIFANDPSGSFLCNNSEHFRPEVAVIRFACLLPGDREWLAWEPACDDVASDWFGEITDVFVDWGPWPVLLKNSSCIFVLFTKSHCLPSDPLCSQGKSSDA
jgi:hypothetical protein